MRPRVRAVVAGHVAVFVLWDVIFCGGKRCELLIDRLEQLWKR